MALIRDTDAARARILESVQGGNYVSTACKAAGISRETFYSWKRLGQQAEGGVYREFFEALKRAEVAAEERIVKQWQAAVPEDWKAGRDLLARRYSNRWSEKQKREISGPKGGPIVFTQDVSDETLRRFAAMVKAPEASSGEKPAEPEWVRGGTAAPKNGNGNGH